MGHNAIFVTVRTSSTRLPQKCLLDVGGAKAIEFYLRWLKRSVKADFIVVCTTENSADDVLCEIAEKEGVKFFRGSEEDKLERWHGACQKFDVDFFVTADGDDIFCEPELIDLAFAQYAKDPCDFVEAPGLVAGAFTYGIKASALKKVCEIKGTSETEMMWVYFTDTGHFDCRKLENVPEIYKRPEIRMTIDYPDDLVFFRTIVDHFGGATAKFNLRDIVKFLDDRPEVIKINQHLHQDFLANQAKKTKLILKEQV